MESFILEAMKYFTDDQWTKLEGYEQLKYGKICYLYYACIELDIYVQPPEFMSQERPLSKQILVKKEKHPNVTILSKNIIDEHLELWQKSIDFTGKKKLCCDQCNYSTDNAYHIKRHKLSHTKEKRFVCNFCMQAFGRNEHLKRHMKSKHLNQEEEYRCELCSYKSHRKDHLTNHLKTHWEIKPFICEICNKGYTNEEELTQHLCQYTQDKRYRCSKCNKVYLTKAYLSRHINAFHSKLYPYKCEQCEFSTATKASFARHIRTHFMFLGNKY